MKHKAALPLGVIFQALSAFFLWSVSDAFTRLAGLSGAPKIEILFLSSFSGAMALLLSLAVQKSAHKIRPKNLKMHAINVGLVLCTGFGGLASYTLLPLTSVYVILFMSPMLIAIFAALFMGEPLRRGQILAILAGFLGVVLAINPMVLMENKGDWLGYFAASFFLVTFTGLCLMMRIMRKTETPESITFIAFFVRALCFLPFALWTFSPMRADQIFYSCGIGLFSVAGNVLITHAYHKVSSASIAPLQYFQILFGAALGYGIWGDTPTLTLALGACVIVGSGVVLLRASRTSSPPIIEG